MTIVVAGAHKAAAAAGTRAHATTAAAPDDGGGDSFMAMLAALDIDVTTEPTGDGPVGLTVPGDDAPPTRGHAGKPLSQTSDPLQAQDMSAANAALMLQAALPARDAVPAATTADTDGATTGLNAAIAGVAAPAATQAAAGRPGLMVSVDGSAPSASRTLPVPGAPPGTGLDPAAGVAEAMGAQRAAPTDTVPPPAVRPDARLQRLDALHAASQQLQATAARAIASTPADSPVLLSMAGQDLLAQRPERDRPTGTLPSAQADAGWKGLTTTAPPLLAPVDAAGASAPGTHDNLAERMVEQVSWWLSQKTQGAELTLNMPGGAPVSVSVQVQGNEAQVVFRSDHADARQLLGDALPQLKDMFGSEGLMLTGASVGSSAGDASGDAAARPSQPTAHGRQAATIELPAAVEPVRRQAAGRLDLYVNERQT